MKSEFKDIPNMTVTIFIVSAKPDSLISDEQSDLAGRKSKKLPSYLDIDEIENIRTYLKKKR